MKTVSSNKQLVLILKIRVIKLEPDKCVKNLIRYLWDLNLGLIEMFEAVQLKITGGHVLVWQL